MSAAEERWYGVFGVAFVVTSGALVLEAWWVALVSALGAGGALLAAILATRRCRGLAAGWVALPQPHWEPHGCSRGAMWGVPLAFVS